MKHTTHVLQTNKHKFLKLILSQHRCMILTSVPKGLTKPGGSHGALPPAPTRWQLVPGYQQQLLWALAGSSWSPAERGNSSVKLASMLCSAPPLALPAWWAPHHDGALPNDTCCACVCRAGGAGGMQGHSMPFDEFAPLPTHASIPTHCSIAAQELWACCASRWGVRVRRMYALAGAGRAVNMAWQLQLQHLAILQVFTSNMWTAFFRICVRMSVGLCKVTRSFSLTDIRTDLKNSVRVWNPSDIWNVRTDIRTDIFSGTLRSWKKGVTDILTDILGIRTEGGSLVGIDGL